MCGKMEIGCYIQAGFQTVTTNAMDQLQEQVTKGALTTLGSMTIWLRPNTPDLANQQDQATGTVKFLQGSLLSVTAAVFAIAIIIAGIRIAWEQRAQPLQDLLKTILTFVVVGTAGAATMQLLSAWSDGFSVAIIDQAGKDLSLAATFGGQVDGAGRAQSLVADGMPALLAITTGLGVILASLIQIVLMLVRSALLVLLAGAFPLAAAATNTEIGRNWFKKFCGWSLAFIAYKPAAALVYAAAMKVAHDPAMSTSDAVVRAMTGMMMLLLAIFALPALMRFMVPVTAAVAGGSAGMGSSVADPGGVASGAINVGSSGAGFGSARGGGSSPGGSTGGSTGGGATGAQAVGAKAAGAAAGAAAVGLAAARKTAGGIAGAASHSAGESGGGSITPPSASGPMARRPSSRSPRPNQHSDAHSATQNRTPEPVGPSGNW
ncbi:type IV secretion system protein [Kribbella sp. NPDC004536]|uniref:type IV secretion system protein n=1 Tax=Kribbella sp. NPDC004536 TaxID=3364106 RepID=UPI0036C29C98